jgi:hypothetical protein
MQARELADGQEENKGLKTRLACATFDAILIKKGGKYLATRQ